MDENNKIVYKGLDGNYYYTREDLELANQRYKESRYRFIAKDGREYSSMEDVERVNRQLLESQMARPIDFRNNDQYIEDKPIVR